MSTVEKIIDSHCIIHGDIEYRYQILWNGVCYVVLEVIRLPAIAYGESSKFQDLGSANLFYHKLIDNRNCFLLCIDKALVDVWYDDVKYPDECKLGGWL